MYKVREINTLPPNQLQRVSIIRCSNFNSLQSLENIRSIHLEDLKNITSLTGLGPKNQIVKLVGMEHLNDMTALKDSYCVEINDCPFLLDVSSLQVKVLVIQDTYHQWLGKDSANTLLRQIEKMHHLRELKLSFPLTYDDVRSLIFSLSNVIKFCLTVSDSNEEEKRWNENQDLRENYFVTKTKLPLNSLFHIVLVRKI